jgi:ATP-dependent Clp protease ATP-binding subunit ClpC
MEFLLDLSSTRTKRAHYRQILSQKWLEPLFYSITALSLLGGLYLLVAGSPLCWIVFWPASGCLVLLMWRKGDLNRVAVGPFKNGNQLLLHQALDLPILARFTRSDGLSAYDIWKALEGSEEHYFIQNRYLIDPSFYENLVSKQAGSATAVWNMAAALQEKYQINGFPSMLVMASVVLSTPDIEQVLHRIQLSPEDVEAAVPWMEDIKTKRMLARAKKNFGGIGRDWAYGYTPILGSLGRNISQEIETYGFFIDTSMHESVVTQMLQVMGNSGTVTLVGEAGVGKTTCVHAFAERLLTDGNLPKSIRSNQIVALDASSLIANAQGPGQLENLMIKILNEAHHAKNIILFFDEAQAFFDSGTGAVDLSHVLAPALESTSVRLIFAMDPTHWQRLTSKGITAKLQPVNVPASDEINTLAVLRDQISVIEYKHHIVYTYQALREAFKLGTRYAAAQQAMPGAALQVLEQTAGATQQQLITREIVQQAVEQTYGIKIQTAQGQGEESAKLLELETKLKQRVISQERAIKVVANALRRARSGVGNPDRPIGTFLFLGPTGVGKTELSKALAAVYFDNEQAMIRVDMNQYVGPEDVARLISPMQGTELGFLGEVRKKPFSVILLDEIEKAHPSVVNALLQMLDEGVMRDSDNKPVSFRDAIIIATSNAGADEIRRLIDEGQDLATLEKTFTDTLISRGAFAPEFVNRFDEVVLFKPLTQDELVKVIDLIIAGINKTLDAQKVHVSLTDAAKHWLVGKGYDSKLGARPMRRMAQRYVENTVAKKLLEQSLQSGGTIELDVADFEQGE